jgi:beta-carotene hydroxylase
MPDTGAISLPTGLQVEVESDASVAALVRECHQAFPWPALLIAVGCFIAFAAVTLLSLDGTLPLAAGFSLNTYILITVFSPLHEAVHQNLSGGRSGMRWLNTAIGHVSGAMQLLAFPVFRASHLSHHGRTNDPELDPDYRLKSRNAVQLVFSLLTIIPHYIGFYASHPAGRRTGLVHGIADTLVCVAVYGAPVVLWFLGYGLETLALWVGPAVLAAALLSLLHWTLHIPHDSRERYRNARVVISSKWFSGLVRLLYQDQHCHLIHHLFPRIPVHMQRIAFERIRPVLEAKGSPITEL